MRIVLSLALGFAQLSSVVTLSNGIQVRIIGTASPLATSFEPASGNSFYRIYRDENKLTVFAYEIEVERTPDGSQFHVTAKPAGANFAARHPNADAGKPVPTLSEPLASPLLNSGGRFVIEVPTDPGITEKVTDTVQVVFNARGTLPQDSGPAELRFASLKVAINGKLASPAGAGAIVSGQYAMFYLPGRGGYFFATGPVTQRPFVQAGSVDKTRLRFQVDNDAYECESDTPILLKSDRGELYVYHDPGYRPSGNWTKNNPAATRDEFFTAASDSLSWWLP